MRVWERIIVLAFAALIASEWLARRATIRFHGE